MTVPDSLKGLYPWTGKRLEVRPGIHMHYLDEGQGEPLVFVHGNPSWSFLWRHLIAGLSDSYRCVAVDHVGCGLSDKPPESSYGYRLDDRARDLGVLLGHLELRRGLTLVAHDWGGMIALAWATRFPQAIKRLVLFNTAGFGLPQGRTLPWQIGVVRHLPTAWLVRGLNAFALGATRTCTVGAMDPAVREGFLLPYNSWDNRVAIHRFVLDIPLAPGDPSWERVEEVSLHLRQWATTPVFIGWGERDFVFDASFRQEWERRLPSAEMYRYPDAGHYVLEDAHAQILPELRAFLARTP